MKKKIMLLSHIPIRDNTIDKGLQIILERNGHQVWVWNACDHARRAICMVKPDLLIVPEIRLEYFDEIMRQCKEWGIQIVVRRGEMGHSRGGDFHPDFQEALFGRFDIYKYIDLDLVWGPEFKKMIMERWNAPSKKIRVVGAPFDYYVKTDWKIPPPKPKPSILVCTGFGYAACNPLYAIPEAKTGSPIHAIKVKEHRAAQHEFVRLMRLILAKYNCEVHLRVHAGEREDMYGDALAGFKNLYFCASEYPYISLRKHDLMIHSGSTMGFEAHLMGRPGMNFGNFCKDKATGAIHPIYHDVDKLVEDINKIDLTKSNADPKAVKHLVDNYYYKIDGKFKSRVLRAINSLPDNVTNIPNVWPDVYKGARYPSAGVLPPLFHWTCRECNHQFITKTDMHLVKCPCCGIACVRVPKVPVWESKLNFSDGRAVQKEQGLKEMKEAANGKMQPMSNAGNKARIGS